MKIHFKSDLNVQLYFFQKKILIILVTTPKITKTIIELVINMDK